MEIDCHRDSSGEYSAAVVHYVVGGAFSGIEELSARLV
jgi:hypothetical protein